VSSRPEVDCDRVVGHAGEPGRDLNEIILFYTDLKDDETMGLERHNFFGNQPEAFVMGRLDPQGLGLFADDVATTHGPRA